MPQSVRFGAYAAILLFSTTGMMLLVGANDLVVMFVALELMSIPIYALVAITRWRQRSTEGAIKYFTMGALSTAVTAYGVGWLYGVTGETSFAEIGAGVRAARNRPAGVSGDRPDHRGTFVQDRPGAVPRVDP